MQPEFKHKPAFKVVGMKLQPVTKETAKTEIPALWGRFMPRLPEIKHRKPGPTYGLCEGSPSDMPSDDDMTYIACTEVDRLDDLPPGMVGQEVDAHEYAVFTHKGPITNIQATIDYIWGSWLPKSGLRVAKSPDFEVYDHRFHPEGGEFELWVPITP